MHSFQPAAVADKPIASLAFGLIDETELQAGASMWENLEVHPAAHVPHHQIGVELLIGQAGRAPNAAPRRLAAR